MGETTSEIRRDIVRTRQRMAGTIDALGYKFDIRARARYRLAHIMDEASEQLAGAEHDISVTFAEAKDAVNGTLAEAKGSVASTVEQAKVVVDSNGGRRMIGDRVHAVIGTMQSEVSEVKGDMINTVTSRATPLVETAKSQGRAVTSFVQANALFIGVGAFVAGLVAGLFIPKTRIEGQRATPLASKEIAEETLEGIASSARRVGVAKQGGQTRQTPSGRV